uniref:carcinoembryonic antigen-related cell adhesion molecule 3 n=1 Tax=Ictidomys tridecemlineatus TaxID=43179 RepID=UPI001A9E0DF0|nr:carcinoembryonic antigen-related cell adhesion molecule 3 [Ictidomys tridecemlineatus]
MDFCLFHPVSLLTFWNPHPAALLTILSVPSDAAEGTDVFLLVHDAPEHTVGYAWYRGEIVDRSHLIVSYSNLSHTTIHGPAFSGREKIYFSGFLLFVNVTQEDTGFYTLQTTAANFDTEAATGEFRVHKERTPGLLVGAIASFVTGVLVGVALVAALRCFLVHRRTGRLPPHPLLALGCCLNSSLLWLVSSKASETPEPQHQDLVSAPSA